MASIKPPTGPLYHYHLENYHEPLEVFDPFDHMEIRIAATVADMTDRAIVNAILDAARKDGIDDLYLIDKRFILEAIKEKLAREKAKEQEENHSKFGRCLGYSPEPCPNCGRLRLERYEKGKEVCEKCDWCPQEGRYVNRREMWEEDHG